MRPNRQAIILIGAVAITVCTAILLIILPVFFRTSNSKVTEAERSTSNSQGQFAASPVVVTPVATTTPISAMPYVTVTTPTVPVGDVIDLPSELYLTGNMNLRHASISPQVTIEGALGAIKGSWQKGGQFDGKVVTVTATFGLATFGKPGPNGKWVGITDVPEFTCAAIRQCTRTGKTLDHIENRPMWVLDYKNLTFYGSGATYNHTVYTVDDKTDLMLYGWAYNEP